MVNFLVRGKMRELSRELREYVLQILFILDGDAL
jgi:hypothetical protein